MPEDIGEEFEAICERCGRMTDNKLGSCTECGAPTSGWHECRGFFKPGRAEFSSLKCYSCTKKGG